MKIIPLTFLGLFSAVSFAQSIENFSIDNGGQLVNNNQLQVVYTIGETVVNEFSNETFLVSEGFINSSILNASLSNKDYTLRGLSIYPNPTVDFLFINHSSVKNRTYRIFNAIGQEVLQLNLQESLNTINVKNLSKGIYLLVIHNTDNKEIRKFKFVKK